MEALLETFRALQSLRARRNWIISLKVQNQVAAILQEVAGKPVIFIEERYW
jgi:hypothetical protein